MSRNTNKGSLAKSVSMLAGIIQREGMLTLLLQGRGHGIGLINKVRKGKVVTFFRETEFLKAEKLEESSR